MTDQSNFEANKRIRRRVLLELWGQGRLEVTDELAERDLVVSRFSARGTHLGPFLGAAPTGEPIGYTGTDINRVHDGRIVESWVHYDALGLLQQLGLAPELPGP